MLYLDKETKKLVRAVQYTGNKEDITNFCIASRVSWFNIEIKEPECWMPLYLNAWVVMLANDSYRVVSDELFKKRYQPLLKKAYKQVSYDIVRYLKDGDVPFLKNFIFCPFEYDSRSKVFFIRSSGKLYALRKGDYLLRTNDNKYFTVSESDIDEYQIV